MGFGMRPVPRQLVSHGAHTALWNTYLQLGEGPVMKGPRKGGPSLTDTLARLDSAGHELPPLVVGTALWNLLPMYQDEPPEEFSRLLLKVLDVDVNRARNLRRQAAYAVFPPLPGGMNLILDSDFTVGNEGAAARARLEVIVESDFNSLRGIVSPDKWSDECPLFWEQLERKTDHTFTGTLRLPGGRKSTPLSIDLEGTVTDDGVTARADLGIEPPAPLGGRFTLEVEALTKPGWTRIIQERSVTFAPGPMQRYGTQTLAYWTKTEIACLALR